MTSKTYPVRGMSCDHCVQAVKSEVGKLPGVSSVDVDVAAGVVTVTAESILDDAAVAAAVDEAGYEVVV